jgi:HAD superfamily hydrolase (TIGR01458 family)
MASIEGVLLDLSGVLYVGETVVPGALEAVERVRASGLPLRFLTNTTRMTRARVHARLSALGFGIEASEIFTSPGAVRSQLVAEGLRPLLLIHPGLEPEFADLDCEAPNAVVLGDAGDGFTYAALNRAFRMLMDGAPLLAMGDNRYFRESDGLSLDIGPFVKALEYAAGVEARVLGKPARDFFHGAVAELGCAPEACVMVGDDAHADVEGALAAGLRGVLVRTGKYRSGDEDQIALPGAVTLDDIAAAVDWILGEAAPGSGRSR